ncbi:hypothetical protein [Actinomadura terrae]|uniref:hypothetical protein n=1 Tax=Actinomadura terrae TaxID=604353 RepID=UPI001FA6DEF2|nr:hypothetical protein [Actinomadura terrae]
MDRRLALGLGPPGATGPVPAPVLTPHPATAEASNPPDPLAPGRGPSNLAVLLRIAAWHLALSLRGGRGPVPAAVPAPHPATAEAPNPPDRLTARPRPRR